MCSIHVCKSIPFPLVSVARFLLQDFRQLCRKFHCIDDSHSGQFHCQARHLSLFDFPVIPYHLSDGGHGELEINCLMTKLDLQLLDYKLRGIQDLEDCQFDHLSKIFFSDCSCKGH